MPGPDRTHKTTIEVEVEAYRRARSALGTRGYKDTVNEALKAVDRAARLRRGADLIRAGGLDLPTPDELEEIRRPRRF
jgi:hypothetical protein